MRGGGPAHTHTHTHILQHYDDQSYDFSTPVLENLSCQSYTVLN
jgi:hypothetical protein